jgi:hypothetical protein
MVDTSGEEHMKVNLNLNSDFHNFETRSRNDLHLPSSNLSLYQNGVFYSRIKLYNHLPINIENLTHDIKRFKKALKGFMLTNSFYSLDKYFTVN